MVLADHRSLADPILDPLARRLEASGIHPNHITGASLAVAAGAGVAFWAASPSRPLLLLLGALLVLGNALMDGVDGKLARATDQAGPRGDYLDHAVDRFADVLILGGLALSPLVSTTVGLVAVAAMLLTSYLGTQAQAVGLGRNLGGLLGRADRLLLLGVVPAVEALLLLAGVLQPWRVLVAAGPLVVRSLSDALVYILAAMGLLTAIQRFLGAWKAL